MKKQVAAYIASLGGSSAYSGDTKTMFINDPKKDHPIQSIESAVVTDGEFGKLSSNGNIIEL